MCSQNLLIFSFHFAFEIMNSIFEVVDNRIPLLNFTSQLTENFI
jgi:hypothetical protein